VQFPARIAWSFTFLSLLAAGCNQNPFIAAQPPAAWRQPTQPQSYASQLQDLDRRANALDADNRDLHGEIAKFQQERQLLKDQVAALQKRLNETANQLREAQVANQEAEKKVQAVQASTRRRGGATITANNSVQESLQVVEIRGFEVRQDGDVIRVEVPADTLFHAQGAQLLPAATQVLDQLADAVARHYSNQMIGVEAHTDSTPLTTTSSHQLAAAQGLAVFQILTSRNRISSKQLFVVAHGSNHPQASNATPSGRSKNRRIELVIYPETASRE
jgi:flagellar motor protein MotB